MAHDQSGTFILITAPPGVGLRTALVKLQRALGPHTTEIQDVEDILCSDHHTENALKAAGIDRIRIGMYDVAWHLGRSLITSLWNEAVQEALHRLRTSEKPLKILSCHLVLYNGKRDKFFSPVNPMLLSGSLNLTHLLLLIDDLYDMYLRLTSTGDVFDPKSEMADLLTKAQEDGINLADLPKHRHASFCMEWQMSVMTKILWWRHLETILAENIAVQLSANFLVWSVKQITKPIALWVKNDHPVSVYFSHPISRPRRQYRITKTWHEAVFQFNKLQAELCKRGLVGVMPTGIDEYRISKITRDKIEMRQPLLEERWPMPERHLTLYSPLDKVAEQCHKDVLGFKLWDFQRVWLFCI